MLFNFLFCILFTLSLVASGIAPDSVVCGNNPTDTVYIADNDDILSINDCNIMNSSIYIHGENNIFSIEEMDNIREILGDLVIVDTTELKNLAGLKNIDRILGLDLYLDTYSIVIRDNPKLAFTDTINWSKITNYPVKINNNSINVECYETCVGCFGPGPYLCQDCVNTSFWGSSVCVNKCLEYHNESNYCHRIPPLPMEITAFINNSTNMNFTWSINENEPYPYLINGVNILFNDLDIYNYSIDSTGYSYDQTFNETFEVSGLYPNTQYNITGMLYGNNLMSNHTFITFTTPDYILPNITDFLAIQNYSTGLILMLWNEVKIPPSTAFSDSHAYYSLNITDITGSDILIYDNLNRSYKIIDYNGINIFSGDYNVAIKSYLNAPILDRIYESSWFYDTFTVQTTPTTSPTSTATSTATTTKSTTVTTTVTSTPTFSPTFSPSTSSTSSSSSSTKLKNDNDDSVINILLILIYIFVAITILLLIIYYYFKYREQKRQNTLSRLTGRNRALDNSKPVAYANTIYDPTVDNPELNDVDESTSDVGSPTSQYFSRDAMNNPNYNYFDETNYYDC